MKYNPAISRLDIPARMLKLPIDERGYPIPKFVETLDGKPDFRVVKRGWVTACIKQKLCWVCGEPLGRHLAFVIGPMCAINRVSSEPPSHLDCARFSAKGCPFLTQPKRIRNEHDLPEHKQVSGIAFARNPGVALIWVTESYKPFKPHTGGLLIEVGEPTKLEWYARGRQATRAEIMESIESGLPALRKVAEIEGAVAVAEFHQYVARGLALVPAG
jgi:hypothetical protein